MSHDHSANSGQTAQYVACSLLEEDGVSHGYFTRRGGCSSGVFGSLNAGLGSGDKTEDVVENRRRICASLNASPENLATLYQCHSSDVHITQSGILQDRPKADGIVTNKLDIALGVVTADCGPVLLSDQKNKVIAAAHAGWQGAFNGVIENTITEMENLGAQRSSIKACLGPTISQANYETGPEFIKRFTDKDASFAKYFQPSSKAEHFMFNLCGFIQDIFDKSGVEHEVLNICTYANEDDYFSYRRATHQSQKDYGRQLSVIVQR